MIRNLLLALAFVSAVPAFAQFEGNALDFDGTNDMVVVSAVPSVFSNLATTDLTIEAWVNPRGSLFARILFAQPSTTNFVSLGTSTGNVIYFYVIKNGTTYSVATTTSIPQNQWSHVAARWTSATNAVEVFFNGVLQPTVAGGSSSTGTNGLMVLGSRPGGAQYFNGLMDEVRVWSEARTQCEIQNNMNISLAGPQTNLAADYNFNNGTAGGNNTGVTTLADNSGSGFAGTLTNFTLTGTTSNWVTSGATVTSSGNAVNGYTYSEAVAVCSGASYTYPDGTTESNITAPTSHVSTIIGGCDTIITTNVSVNPVYSSSAVVYVCSGDSYTYPDNTTDTNITGTIVHNSNLQSISGCDSVITTTVNVNPVSSASESFSFCGPTSYVFPDGTTMSNITSQVTHISNLTSSAGCDSTITTTVNINTIYSQADSAVVCSGSMYTFPDGSSMTISGPASHTSNLSSISGCDSTITTFVDIIAIDTGVAALNETLTADEAIATYQWLDCGNNYAPLAGETNQSFTALVNGSYAVEVTVNGCSDTSACYLVLSTGILTAPAQQYVMVYPNPAEGNIQLSVSGTDHGVVEVVNVAGQVVLKQQFTTQNFAMNIHSLEAGMYFIRITSEAGVTTQRIEKR